MVRVILIWLMIIPLAILNGALRESILIPAFGSYALPMSGIILCLLIFLLAIIFRKFMRLASIARSLSAGLLWFCLTVLFESGFGLMQGSSWNEILAAYDIRTGNLWLLVVLSAGLAPVGISVIASEARRSSCLS